MKIPSKPFRFFLLATVYDLSMTYYLIYQGLGSEANPVMAYLINQFGLAPGLLIGKGVGLILIVAVLKRVEEPPVLSRRFRLQKHVGYVLYGLGVFTIVAGSWGVVGL